MRSTRSLRHCKNSSSRAIRSRFAAKSRACMIPSRTLGSGYCSPPCRLSADGRELSEFRRAIRRDPAMSARLGMNKFRLTSLVRLSRSWRHSRFSCRAASHRAHADPAVAPEQRPAARLAGTAPLPWVRCLKQIEKRPLEKPRDGRVSGRRIPPRFGQGGL